MQKTKLSPSPILLFSLLAATITMVLSGLILRHGMTLWPDSWAYWQGAVSLLSGKHYVYFFHNLPIKDWPPLYSIYLMVWQKLFGVSVRTLILSTLLLAGLSAFAWSWCTIALAQMIFGVEKNRVRLLVYAAVLLFIACYVSYYYQSLLADNLKYALLPLLLYASITAVRQTNGKLFFLWTLAAGFFASLLMLAHSGSLAFVAAASVILSTASFPMRLRISAVLFFVTLSIVPWWLVEKALDQTHSHPLGWGIANFTPMAYAEQIAAGIGNLVAFHSRLGLALFAVVVTPILVIYYRRLNNPRTKITEEARRVVGLYSVFGMVSLVMLFLIFNITWIENSLDGRFLFFIPLMFIPLGFVLSMKVVPSSLTLIVACLLLLPLLHKIGTCIKTPGAFGLAAGSTGSSQETYLAPHCAIRYGIVGRLPFWSHEKLIVSPPPYPWIEKPFHAPSH